MSDIELHYFPIHGFRGLMSRLVLKLSGLEYTENTIEFKDWQTTKPSKFFVKNFQFENKLSLCDEEIFL